MIITHFDPPLYLKSMRCCLFISCNLIAGSVDCKVTGSNFGGI